MFYETIDDITADAGIRVKAETLEELFCKAVLATFNEITDIRLFKPRKEYTIKLRGKLPFLLADTINRLLLLHEKEGFVPCRCKVTDLGDSSVELYLKGDKFDPTVHPSKLLIKAATYHRLRVDREGDSYVAEVIFDI